MLTATLCILKLGIYTTVYACCCRRTSGTFQLLKKLRCSYWASIFALERVLHENSGSRLLSVNARRPVASVLDPSRCSWPTGIMNGPRCLDRVTADPPRASGTRYLLSYQERERDYSRFSSLSLFHLSLKRRS